MQTVEQLFADYAAYHQTPGNKMFHRVGVPLIMLSLIGMLTHVGLFDAGTLRFDAAMLLIALACAYYVIVEWRLAMIMVVISTIFYFVSALIPFWFNVGLFVLGWVFQFIGHAVYEHRQPAFLRNFLHLLIAPLWIINGVIPIVKTGGHR